MVAAHVDVEALADLRALPLRVMLSRVPDGIPAWFGNDAITAEMLAAAATPSALLNAVAIGPDFFAGDRSFSGSFVGGPIGIPRLRGDLIVVSPHSLKNVDAARAPWRGLSIGRSQATDGFRSDVRGLVRPGEASACFIDGGANRIAPSRALIAMHSPLDRSPPSLAALFDAGRVDAERFLARYPGASTVFRVGPEAVGEARAAIRSPRSASG